MTDRLRLNMRPIRSGLTSLERGWLGFILFFGLILLTDRLSNFFPDLRPLDGVIYLVGVLCVGFWGGLFSGLACCLVLVAYAWVIYHFPGLSVVARSPAYATKAIVATAILYPPFALVGGIANVILRRAAKRVAQAQAEAQRESESRRVVEAELWTSEETRRAIVESSVDAVIGIAPDGTVSMWSPNAEKLFGWTRDEAIGKPASSRIVAPNPLQASEIDVLAGLGSGRNPVLRRQIETTAQTKSGDHVAVELYIADHETEVGATHLVFARDISERKRAEGVIRDLNRDLRELNSTLEARVAERTRQLEAANEELLGFTYSVSHDLRAPLRAIIANSRIVCEDGKGLLSEDLHARLVRLESNAVKMAQLIDNLLQYARIGRVQLASQEVDLSSIANHVGTELKALRDGTLIVRPGILVQGDPELLELVLVNLMENAWKYVLPDQPPHVEVGITQDGAVFVRDQGVGFDMKYVEKVWEPFERLHKESDYPGTGIGLANSKRVIDRHGGRIWTESAPGKGTTVYFTVGNATAPLEFSSTSEVRRRARVR